MPSHTRTLTPESAPIVARDIVVRHFGSDPDLNGGFPAAKVGEFRAMYQQVLGELGSMFEADDL